MGTVLNAIMFAPAAYMAVSALQLYQQSDGAAQIAGVLFLFFALPVFCIAAPLAAWRAEHRGRVLGHIIAVLAAPLVYAMFLAVFLMESG
jgi:hypothetical protein